MRARQNLCSHTDSRTGVLHETSLAACEWSIKLGWINQKSLNHYKKKRLEFSVINVLMVIVVV